VAPGAYVVRVRAEGFETAEHGIVSVGDRTRATGIDLVLVRAGLISGRVVDPRGAPVADVPVSVTVAGSRSGRRRTRTDEDGRFRVAALAEAPHEVICVHGLRLRILEGVLPDGEELLIRVNDLADLEGRVRGPDGEPAEDFRVLVRPTSKEDDLESDVRVFATRAGRFVFRAMDIGAYDVEVEGPGGLVAPIRRGVVVRPGRAPLELTLERGAVLAGRVRSASGEIVDGARVTVQRLRGGRPERPWFLETREGAWRQDGLRAGVYRITTRHDELGRAETTVRIELGREREVDLTLGE
jgi:hypothetical protein